MDTRGAVGLTNAIQDQAKVIERLMRRIESLERAVGTPDFNAQTLRGERLTLTDGGADRGYLEGSDVFGLNSLIMHADDVITIDSSNLNFSGLQSGPRLRLTSTDDASLSSTDHALQIGPTNGTNLIVDNNEIIARNNGANSSLSLQFEGGNIQVGGPLVVRTPTAAGVVTGTIQGVDGGAGNRVLSVAGVNGITLDAATVTVDGTSMMTTTAASVTSNLTVTSGWDVFTFNIRQVTPNLFQFAISLTNNTGSPIAAGNHGNVTVATVNNTGNGARIRGTNTMQCILVSGSSGAQIGTYVPSTGVLQLVWSGAALANAGSANLYGLVVVN